MSLVLPRRICLIVGMLEGGTHPSPIQKRPFFLPSPASMTTSVSKGAVKGFASSPCTSAYFSRYFVSRISLPTLTHFTVPSFNVILRLSLHIENTVGFTPVSFSCKREHENT